MFFQGLGGNPLPPKKKYIKKSEHPDGKYLPSVNFSGTLASSKNCLLEWSGIAPVEEMEE